MAIQRVFLERSARRNLNDREWEEHWFKKTKPAQKENYRREAEACLVAAGAIKGRRL